MSALDFVALLLASLIVALTMSREVRDINIGEVSSLTDSPLREASPPCSHNYLTTLRLVLTICALPVVFSRR